MDWFYDAHLRPVAASYSILLEHKVSYAGAIMLYGLGLTKDALQWYKVAVMTPCGVDLDINKPQVNFKPHHQDVGSSGIP